jgi:hypothetical protein
MPIWLYHVFVLEAVVYLSSDKIVRSIQKAHDGRISI